MKWQGYDFYVGGKKNVETVKYTYINATKFQNFSSADYMNCFSSHCLVRYQMYRNI